MREVLEYGSAPYGEDCVQVNSNADYMPAMRKEARVYARQLLRKFPELNEKGRLHIKSNSHDFGSYIEVSFSFNDEDDSATELAYKVDSNLPEFWDDIAKQELLADEIRV